MERTSSVTNFAECNRIGVKLQMTDARLALTFLDMAERTNIVEDRTRRVREARHAYESIIHFLKRLNPTPQQGRILSALLSTLESRLRAIGSDDENGRGSQEKQR